MLYAMKGHGLTSAPVAHKVIDNSRWVVCPTRSAAQQLVQTQAEDTAAGVVDQREAVCEAA